MKVAVIGAGASGLSAVKSCLEEGLEPTCYEKCDYIGGLWHYKPAVVPGEPSVMKSTVCNVSKEMMCYSDFPAPKEFPVYMHNRQTDEYLEMYADAFGLKQYIKTYHEVIEIKESPDHDMTGRWIVRVKNRNTELVEQATYDFVMVCSGIFGKPNIPDMAGLSMFEGRMLHTYDFRDVQGFEDKIVLVVGFGNSAGDAAVDVSNMAKQVYLSSRSGGWVFCRVNKYGLPFDLQLSRASAYIPKILPNFANNVYSKELNKRVDHTLYGFCPKMGVTKYAGFLNDDLPVRVLNGTIKIKPDVARFTRNGVQFQDGTSHEIDTVIFGTGYYVNYPFLSDDVIGSDKAGFYKGIFPTGRKWHTLALIGCVRIRGGILPVVEMQSRVAVQVFKGTVKLPSNEKMREAVKKKKEDNRREKSPYLSYILQANFVDYLDELSETINCKPSFGQLLFTDFRLAMKCIFGPCCPFQYRLTGPGAWKGAREAIMTLMDRIYYPLNPNYSRALSENKKSNAGFKMWFILAAVMLLLYFVYVK